MQARLLPLTEAPWSVMDAFQDRTVFQTRDWLNFIAEAQGGKPVVAELREGGEMAGYFTGMTVERFGVRILGSSFPGWTTPYIGFNLIEGASRKAALEAVEKLAFGPLKCLHMEISDRGFTVEDGASLGFTTKFYESYETDLSRSEEELFSGMESACRRCIRKAEKCGVRVEEASDLGFADDYYAQLVDVFGKQKLVPTYEVERVRLLMKHLLPTGNLLLTRAISAEGKCIGTGIYPGFNKVAEFWGNASFRESQILRPNEALHWYALRYWRTRGAEVFDWGGRRSYKEKFGPTATAVPWFYKSRHKVLGLLREQAARVISIRQKVLGRLRPVAQ
jgi:hypothetical protein